MSVNYEVLNKFLDADTLELEYHRVTNNIKELAEWPRFFFSDIYATRDPLFLSLSYIVIIGSSSTS